MRASSRHSGQRAVVLAHSRASSRSWRKRVCSRWAVWSAIVLCVEDRRQEILGCAAKHGAHNVRVFGSTARGETGATSDVDLLVEMQPGRSLIDLVGLWQDLEDLLGTHVDVLSEGGVSPFLHERIYADAVAL